jgi:hypothetical protein
MLLSSGLGHPVGNEPSPGNLPYNLLTNEGTSKTEYEEMEQLEKKMEFFLDICTKAGKSQYPSLCHQLYLPLERGGNVFPLWMARKRSAKDEEHHQEVGQTRTIRDKQFNPWAGKRKRGDHYNPWAGKRSDDQFNPWAGKKRDDKM